MATKKTPEIIRAEADAVMRFAADQWWAWHDADAERWSAEHDDAESRCAARLCAVLCSAEWAYAVPHSSGRHDPAQAGRADDGTNDGHATRSRPRMLRVTRPCSRCHTSTRMSRSASSS